MKATSFAPSLPSSFTTTTSFPPFVFQERLGARCPSASVSIANRRSRMDGFNPQSSNPTRTPEEFSAGHASGAINIPYMYRVGSGMTKNATFTEQVSKRFRKDDEIIIGCQSGKRSMMAAKELLAAGFSAITDIAGGYATWTQNGLPTNL